MARRIKGGSQAAGYLPVWGASKMDETPHQIRYSRNKYKHSVDQIRVRRSKIPVIIREGGGVFEL